MITLGMPVGCLITFVIEEAGSLPVQPGVNELMASGASLIIVYGQLFAEGTSTDRIHFLLNNNILFKTHIHLVISN